MHLKFNLLKTKNSLSACQSYFSGTFNTKSSIKHFNYYVNFTLKSSHCVCRK